MALAPDLYLVLAPNPSPMTYLGTNSYILGKDRVAVIDPGPDMSDHLHALLDVIGGRPVTHIFVTHSHLDYSPLARPLADVTGASILAFGDSNAGRSAVMATLATTGLAGGGESIDQAFRPESCLADGAQISEAWGTMTALHTPGHIGNHLCFQWRDAIFSGDHVMGWASSLISPPDGDLTDFMCSCQRLGQHRAAVFYPGHGGPIKNPAARLSWLIGHRRAREAQILQALEKEGATVKDITRAAYHDTPLALLAAAERNVFAHLVDLHERGFVRARPALSTTAEFRKIAGI